ncbi:MAG TPA: GntR family transcriptional regulator [Thermomicrobiaceae bacterium]|nr:GntR family transcriptional regulator [Thermomicrobiaceae bacterium]
MSEIIFPEVEAAPLSEVILRLVREAIIRGQLAPGQQVNQAELAKQMGVSRAPLREALRQLEKDGLVSNVPYRGTIVTPLTRRSIEELQSFRKLLETFAAQLMLECCGAAELDELEELVEQIARAVELNDVPRMNAADIAFHSRIIELSGHLLVRDVWESYAQQIRRAMTLRNQANRDLTFLIALHRDLVAAFRAHDFATVRRCYDMHGADLSAALSHLFTDDEATPRTGGSAGHGLGGI